MIIVPAVGTPFWLVAALGCSKNHDLFDGSRDHTTIQGTVNVDSETNIAT